MSRPWPPGTTTRTPKTERGSRKPGKFKKARVTDPDASMARTARDRRLEPSYKQHGDVENLSGVVLDVEIPTGETNEGEQLLARLDALAETTGAAIATVTADAGYPHAKAFGGLERRGIDAPIRPGGSRAAARSRCAGSAATRAMTA